MLVHQRRSWHAVPVLIQVMAGNGNQRIIREGRKLCGQRVSFASMRRALLISLAAFYLLLNCGAVLNIHFCCGKLVDWSLNSEASTCCDHEGAGIQKNCCKDISIVFQQDNSQETSKKLDVILPLAVIVPLAFPQAEFCGLKNYHEQEAWPHYDPPPFAVQSDLYLSNRVIRL
jgi:hypothetical protein